MINEIQVFNNPDFGDIRIVMIGDEPWWVGKDVALALEYTNPQKAIRDHVDDEDKGVNETFTPGGTQNLTIINESGLYSLILSSKLPSARKFKRWVTSEVLPALRKTGKYEIHEAVEQRKLTVDDYIRAASIIASCRNERIPIVIGLLEKSGIDVPGIKAVVGEGKLKAVADRDENGETACLINRAINDYGIKQAHIAKLCGLQGTQIMRIRAGEQKPTMDRARIIQDAILNEMAKMDKAE